MAYISPPNYLSMYADFLIDKHIKESRQQVAKEMFGVNLEFDDRVPAGEMWFVKNGEIVGVIRNANEMPPRGSTVLSHP